MYQMQPEALQKELCVICRSSRDQDLVCWHSFWA